MQGFIMCAGIDIPAAVLKYILILPVLILLYDSVAPEAKRSV